MAAPGSDEHLRWLFGRGYHVVAKGMSNRRAVALATQVRRWDAYRTDVWLGEVPPLVDYGRPIRCFVKKGSVPLSSLNRIVPCLHQKVESPSLCAKIRPQSTWLFEFATTSPKGVRTRFYAIYIRR